ncbi:mucin-12 [Oncorhynchus mykiss]|uniref:Ig-like domain-containing protein n=1 Tax=Oncorhynchus mykiss TaxID=8022 RepID=A0A8K9Y5Y7_ONCMY|nr:mucin-12 [Oncorhynchus mykiss]
MRTRKGTGRFVMAVSQWMFCAAVLLLLIQGIQCSPVPPACPESCLCQKGLLNCSFAGLSQAQQHVPSTVTELDLSHNLLKSITPSWSSWRLKSLWLGHNSITHLSLCVRRTWRGKHWKIPLSRSRGRCVSWAPTLQLLSAERNQLEMIPEGLGGSEFLQVLQLSHNRISDLRPGDLSRCPLLREIHLQHNRISNLHPQALGDMPELRVLDLSFNLLTTITPSAYLSLRNLNALVEVSGNRWRCDCSLRSLRRKMAYDRDMALQQTWRGVVCTSPSTHAGRDLLHLEDSDLTCSTAENRAGLHQDVTVDKGTEILLPCGSPKQDSTWWTPNGQVPGSQAGLLISDITERDAGLYVCVSGPHEEFVSVFNLLVHKAQRKTRDTRSLHRERLQINSELGSIQGEGQETDLNSLDLHRATQRTQSDLVLAVCLSVFITFLVAFVIGALTRPLLDALWRRCCSCCNRTKQSASPPQSVSSAGQSPYDNKAYSDEDEREELGTHRERRVTFSGHPSEQRDQNSIPYYDTVANGMQDNLAGEYDATYENVQERDTSHPSLEVYHPPEEEKPRPRGSVSSGSFRHDNPETDTHSGDLSDMSLSEPQRGAYPVHTHGMEFESIPDPEQLQGCRSSSVSSHSDQESPDKDQDMDWPKDNLAQRLEERKTRNNSWEPQSPQKEDDSFERSSDFPTVKPVDVLQINIGRVGEIPGFTYRKSNMADPNPMDPELWNDSGESFEFPDSIQGASARSSSQDLSGSAFADQLRKDYEQAWNKETLVKEWRENDESSSSNSSDSGNEPTEYTVNPEMGVVKEKEIVQDALLTHDSTTDPAAANPYLKHDVSLDKQHYKDPVSPSPGEDGFHVSELRQEVQRSHLFSEHSDLSSDSSDEPTKSTVNKDSDEEEEDEAQVPAVTHKGPSLSLGDINVSLASRKALNIGFSKDGFQYQPEPETRSPGLDRTTQSAISTKEPLPQTSLPSDVARVEDPPVSVYIPRLSKRLDTQPPQEASPAPAKTPPPSESSSSSESEDETTDNSMKLDREVPDVSQKNSSLSLGDINVSLAPRKALNIGFSKQGYQYQPEPEKRLTGVGLSFQSAITPKEPSLPSDGTRAGESPAPFYIPSLRRCLDIQPPQDTTPAPPQTPPPSGSSSSRSESEDETTMNQKREEKAVPDSSFIPAGIDVSFAPRKALNIGFSKEGFQYQSEPSLTGMGLTSQIAISTKEPFPKSSIPSDGTRDEESLVPLYIPSFKRHVGIQPPQETPPAASQTPPPSGSSSSGSESKELDREVPDVTQKDPFLSLGDINVSIAPRKALNISFSKEGFQYQQEPETRLPSLDLSSQSDITPKEPLPQHRFPEGTRTGETPLDIPSLRGHLDIQATQETPLAAPGSRRPAGSSYFNSESEDEMTMNQKREEKSQDSDSSFIPAGIDVSFAPRKALNIGFSKEGFQYQSEPSLTGMGLTSQIAISTKEPLPKSSIPSDGTRDEESLVPLYIPIFKRHVDIQPHQETPPASLRTSHNSESTSSSSESEDETTMNQKREEEKAKVPDVTYKYPSLSPRDTPMNVSFVPRKALNIGFSKENFQNQSSESKYESITTTNDRGFQEDAKPAPKTSIFYSTSSDRARTEEPPVPLYIPGLWRHQNIQPSQDATLAESSSASSENGDELTEHTKKPGRDVTDFSLSPGDTPINVSFAPRRALNISLYNSASTTDEVERKTGAEDRWERPGLGGLKALSETQRWDTKDSSTNMNVSFSQRSALNINSDSRTDEVGRRARADYSSPILERTISRKDRGFEEETNPSPQLYLPKTSSPFSTSTDEARPIESPLQIPRHRRRLVVDIQPHLAPPSAPGTPPPFPEGEEAAGSGWRSRGQQRWRAIDGFGRTSMTQGDEGEKNYMGLLAAKPFGTARQYQSVTPETIMATQHSEISERDGSDLTFSTVRHSEA